MIVRVPTCMREPARFFVCEKPAGLSQLGRGWQ